MRPTEIYGYCHCRSLATFSNLSTTKDRAKPTMTFAPTTADSGDLQINFFQPEIEIYYN
ncbi:hypothetical protein [Halocella sp. SP3-1]|uniref:hypothetical protein n=1 Tax=Halocella sp. SP3-1 TaxID=2382161 RepID=UPI0013E010DD|nr:hypothetical protein [Halocella sp. SP3-1]